MSGIYIHIPFCKQACSYCDFYFVTKTDLMDAFVEALEAEIAYWAKSEVLSSGVKTLYVGGGTPSRLNKTHWDKIHNALHKFDLSNVVEFTVEVNPDDITPDYVRMLKGLGVTRLSMGVQSFQPELLKFMHRAHTEAQAKQAITLIKEAGFESFTLDLIYGNPGQTLEQLKQDVELFLMFVPPHLSAYSLTIEEGTRLGKAEKLGKLSALDEEQVSQHMMFVQEVLESHGYERYEVSNYAKPGHYAKHNSAYWEHETYIGMGPSAHSFIWNDGKQAERFQHERDLRAYCENPMKIVEKTELTREQLVEERFLISLRTKKGISFEELRNRYGFELSHSQQNYLKRLEKQGLVVLNSEKLVLTKQGWLLSDRIALEILCR